MTNTLHQLVTRLNADEKRFIRQYLPLFEPAPAQQQLLLQAIETLSQPTAPAGLPLPLQQQLLPLLLDLLCLRQEDGDQLQHYINQYFDAATLHALRQPLRAIRLCQQQIEELVPAGHLLLAARHHQLLARISMLGQNPQHPKPDDTDACYRPQEELLQQLLLQLQEVEDIPPPANPQ